MKIIVSTFILSCLALLSIGCGEIKAVTAEKHHTVEHFFISSTELTKNDVITINLPKLRPKNLVIVDSNDQWFIIQSAEANVLMMSEEEFSLIKVLELPIKSTKGTIWENGLKITKTVFKESGKYQIYFADNLETEPDNTFNFSAHVIVK